MKKNSAIAHEAVGYLVCVPILCCCVCTLNGMSSTYCVILQFCVCVFSGAGTPVLVGTMRQDLHG